MNKITLIQFFKISLLCLVVTGCGFHLRAALPIPENAQYIFLKSETPFARLESQLKRELKFAGAKFTQPNEAQLKLEILNKKFSRSVQTVDADARVDEFVVTQRVTFQLANIQSGDILIEPTTLAQSDSYAFNRDEVLGKEEQENLLRDDLIREIAFEMASLISGATQTNENKLQSN